MVVGPPSCDALKDLRRGLLSFESPPHSRSLLQVNAAGSLSICSIEGPRLSSSAWLLDLLSPLSSSGHGAKSWIRGGVRCSDLRRAAVHFGGRQHPADLRCSSIRSARVVRARRWIVSEVGLLDHVVLSPNFCIMLFFKADSFREWLELQLLDMDPTLASLSIIKVLIFRLCCTLYLPKKKVSLISDL